MGDALANSPQWLFHDENWHHVINRWANRAKLARGEALDMTDVPQALTDDVLVSADGRISIQAHAHTNDEWVYLYVNPDQHQWDNYSWKIRLSCRTRFKELQFGFRYHNFYNRYRYRFQDGKLSFDMVVNGEFIADLSTHNFAIETNREYEFEIKASGNTFQCWVDGKLLSEDYDSQCHFPQGSIALILWEDNGRTDIVANIKSSQVIALNAP